MELPGFLAEIHFDGLESFQDSTYIDLERRIEQMVG